MTRPLPKAIWRTLPLLGLLACESPTEAISELRFVDIAAGSRHTCALADNGDTYCWGSNASGQLGSEGESSTTPSRVPVASALRSIEAAGSLTCGVDVGGAVHCWGYEQARFEAPTPTVRASDVSLRSLAVSPAGIFALDEQGRLYGADIEIVPVSLPEDLAFRDVVTAFDQDGLGGSQGFDNRLRFCGLTEQGEVYCAEYRDPYRSFKVSGSTGTIEWDQVLGRVQSEVRFRALSAANDNNCGISTEGGLYCWNRSPGSLPVQRLPAVKFESVSVGSKRICAVAEGGQAYCWLRRDPSSAQPVPGGLRFQKVAVGISTPLFEWVISEHVCGITIQGEIYCWGRENGDELDDPDTPRKVTVPQ